MKTKTRIMVFEEYNTDALNESLEKYLSGLDKIENVSHEIESRTNVCEDGRITITLHITMTTIEKPKESTKVHGFSNRVTLPKPIFPEDRDTRHG